MRKTAITEIADKIYTKGRTILDEESGILYFNWTCSGIELLFRGNCLLASFHGMSSEEFEIDRTSGERKIHLNWPWAAVFLDDSTEPLYRFEVEKEQKTQLIYFSEKEETHRIRIVKLTENMKTFLGIDALYTDGEILKPVISERQKKIEFIGDSITCGFGNETDDKDRGFYSGDENGWIAYGPLAARKLEMDWDMICVSGICTGKREALPMDYAMNELYLYSDRILEEKLEKKSCRKWEFKEHPSDYVVVNLGTNDATAIGASDDPEAVEKDFSKDYYEFIKTLRNCNGPEAVIICTLGSINFYLYREIQDIVNKYKEDTGDTKIHCFSYLPMDVRDPVGACGHPHKTTHKKMAQKLADFICEINAEKA